MKKLTTTIVFLLSIHTGWSQVPTTIIKIVPQVVAGSFDGGLTKYSTTIEIINPNVTSVNVSGTFFKEDGTASNLILATNVSTPATITNGILPGVVLDPNKILVLSVGTTPGTTPTTGVIAWGRIVTDAPVTIATFFELRDATTNVLLSRVGVPASPTNMAKFVIPRVRNVATGLDVGFALVNTASTIGTITVTLRDAAGATIATRNLTMAALSHQSLFTQQFFGLTNEPPGTNFNFILFDAGNAGQFAAIALAFEGADQTSFPVDVLR